MATPGTARIRREGIRWEGPAGCADRERLNTLNLLYFHGLTVFSRCYRAGISAGYYEHDMWIKAQGTVPATAGEVRGARLHNLRKFDVYALLNTLAARADFDTVHHVPTALALRQHTGVRSTFGPSIELLNVIRSMFSRLASLFYPNGQKPTLNVAAEERSFSTATNAVRPSMRQRRGACLQFR